MEIGIIAAVSSNGIIGYKKNNRHVIPWTYPEDMKFFKTMTKGCAIVMGKNTYKSIGKPLPDRTNIVLSKTLEPTAGTGLFVVDSIDIALDICNKPYWFIGGEDVYRLGMKYASKIFITLIPDTIDTKSVDISDVAKFPWIDPSKFHCNEITNLPGSVLKVAKYISI